MTGSSRRLGFFISYPMSEPLVVHGRSRTKKDRKWKRKEKRTFNRRLGLPPRCRERAEYESKRLPWCKVGQVLEGRYFMAKPRS